MKKLLFLSISLFIFANFIYSQTNTEKQNLISKRGFYMLPEQGDWALGVDATPIFSYLGSMIGNKTVETYYYSNGTQYSYTDQLNDAPSFAFTAQNPGALYFKYMATERHAYRLKFLFGYSSQTKKLGSGTSDFTDRSITESALTIGLDFGMEYFRPIKSRILGYYGFEGGFLYLPYSGIAYNTNEQVFGKVKYTDKNIASNDYVEKGGGTFGFRAAGFAGVEWFFAPKIAIKGEFGLGVYVNKQTERKYDSDNLNVVVDSGGSGFEVLPYASGNLILSIYF